MDNPRRAGQSLLVGILLPLVVLGMHPTAHDLTADSGQRMTVVNHLVHGIALASQPIVMLGLIGLSQFLGWTPFTTGGIVFYSASMVGMMTAALASGFVASDVLAAAQGGAGGATPDVDLLLNYTHYWNQAFAKLGIIAAGIALVLWSLEILDGRRLSRLSGYVGVIVGIVLALGVLSGRFALNVPGIILATGLEALWMAMVGIQLIRAERPAAGK
ncbi:MAG TPA: hypothetical protein VLD58_00835 [Gemmatimonadales bacterium]|nr:hypothetical protein [Gemmatimonadales bacterium]